MSDTSKKLRAFALAAITAGALVAIPETAHAEPVSPDAKGIVGGAFLGGEVVVFGEAIFGVRSTLAYIVGAGIGAAGGGVGGFFIEKAVDDGRIPAYMLAGGLALLIPAIVVTLDATRYMPTEGAREDKPVVNAPPSDPGKPGGSSVVGAEPGATTPAPTTPAPSPAPSDATPPPVTPPTPAPAPPPGGGGGGGGTQGQRAPVMSLVSVRDGALHMGVPVPEVRPILGSAERVRMGADNKGSELRFPVVRVVF